MSSTRSSTIQVSPSSPSPPGWARFSRSNTDVTIGTSDSITQVASEKTYLPKDADPELSVRPGRTFSLPRTDSGLKNLDEIERAVHGYPRLATFMGNEPGAAIYRRFASLNARVLLYRQAEIVCLEHELDQLEQAYGEHKDLHYSIKNLIHGKPGSMGRELWSKIEHLDNALERYNALLLQQKSLYELPSADDIDINDLNNFAHNEEMGGRWLSHPEDTIWETIQDKGKYKAEQKDLVRLSGGDRYIDPWQRWIWGPCLQFFHRAYSKIRRPDNDAGAYVYDENSINSIAKAISMAFASLLPTASIIALYYINNNLWRLVFILVFSGVFTASLCFFTAATRIEIFIASVGLASVQAVFVGNLIGNGPTMPGSTSNG